MSMASGDLPLKNLDELLNKHFAIVIKVDDSTYPSTPLLNNFNRVIKRESETWSLRGEGYIVEKDFNINAHLNAHPRFVKRQGWFYGPRLTKVQTKEQIRNIKR